MIPSEPPPAAAALKEVLERIEAECARAGRDPRLVRLVAVTKTVPVARIRPLLDAGHRLLGENRVQEALGKMDELQGVHWHLIGHLQTNKARQAVGRFELIHGVDSEKLARELDRRAEEAGLRQAVLVQVRLGGEESKFGVDETGLPRLDDAIRQGCPNLDLRGLMTIPPPVDDPEDSRRWFARLRELAEAEARRIGLPMDELSMGMTDDFDVAVSEGATLVRVGRAIFGERPAPGAPA